MTIGDLAIYDAEPTTKVAKRPFQANMNTMLGIVAAISRLLHVSAAFAQSHSRPYASPIDVGTVSMCTPYVVPCPNVLIVAADGAPRCIHPGQSIFHWNGIDRFNCSAVHRTDIRSRDFNLDRQAKIAFSKSRKCFHRKKIWRIKYEYRCQPDGQWKGSTLRLKYGSKSQSRSKRWLYRRNSKRSAIHFRKSRYDISISENAPLQTHVVTVEAIHESNTSLYYSLFVPEDRRSLNLFSLDTVSGEIRVAKPLDRETLARHVLKITAYERFEPSVSTSATVIVDLLDIQDNAPQFERSSYFAEIREDAPIGTTVMSVFARDFDDGVNGEVEYRLEDLMLDEPTMSAVGGSTASHRFLLINPQSGVIQTIAALDREIAPLILARVIAVDHGAPVMSSEASLEVSVIDVNDNVPRFVQFRDATGESLDECAVNVPENVSTPAVILTLRAEDPDTGTNGVIHYSIVSSTAPIFTVDYVSGVVTISERPALRQSPLSLSVRAKDSGQPANSIIVQCAVIIFDVNDHSPRFLGAVNEEFVHEITVKENSPVGQEIGRLFAIDEDSGTNGEVHYFLRDELSLNQENDTSMIVDVNEVFSLNEFTGSLTSKIPLNRELQDKYRFKVLARDNGQPPLESLLPVLVTIKDVNDNAPTFPKSLYELELLESVPRGFELLRLKATDADVDSKLTYQIESTTRELFTLINVGEQGAILSLRDEFSKHDDKLMIVISATDQGGLQGRCNVSLTVRDINSQPVFVGNLYVVHIPEDSRPGFHVYRMNALDADRGDNAELTFNTDSEYFGIDSKSGLIVVKQPLDRELQSVHVVNVSVIDGGDPPLSSSTTLEVVLDDVNDNSPIFQRNDYRVSISEDMPIGTSFFQLTANDADDGTNGVIDFFLDELDENVRLDKFRLDRTSGTLRVNEALDRETNQRFLLPVIANDRGVLPLSARTIVRIDLEDVNDNAPRFEHRVYEFWVMENAPPGTTVGALAATDPDLGDNARIEFKIFGGADAKFFEIESAADAPNSASARLVTRVEFDYESPTNKFFIEVQANSGQLSSIVSVTICVSDVNDNVPQLKNFTVLIPRYDDGDDNDGNVNLTVGSVPAFDPDLNATLEYFLEPNEFITVDRHNGVLSILREWRYEVRSSVRICVTDGPNHACAHCQVIYIPLTDAHLLNSVSVELVGHRRDDFLDAPAFSRFTDAVAALHDAWLPDDVVVFSAQEFRGDDALSRLNVSFFVSRGGDTDTPFSSWRLEEVVSGGLQALALAIGARVRVVNDELCTREPCAYFQRCRRIHRYVHAAREIIETDSFIFHSLNTIRSFKCECPDGFTTTNALPGTCNQRLDMCYAEPCLNNGTCVPLDGTYRCECPPERSGRNCEFLSAAVTCAPFHCHSGAKCDIFTFESRIENVGSDPVCRGCRWAQPDTDDRCRLRAVSFSGDGYLIVPLALSRLEWTLKMEFATVSTSGTLLFAGVDGLGDYVRISLRCGLLRADVSVGDLVDDRATVEMTDVSENHVNDGEWHTVHIALHNEKLRLWLDDCDAEVSLRLGAGAECAAEVALKRAAAKCIDDLSVPCHRFLDVPPFVALGGRPSSASTTVDDGFVGCLRDMKVDRKLMHFSDFERLERVGAGVAAGCRTFRPDACAFQDPCQGPTSRGSGNAPKCVDKWMGHLCRCPHRIHVAENGCSISTEPAEQRFNGDTSVTFTDESYIVWRLPKSVDVPIELYLEFRTRERATQLIALEFKLPAHHLLLTLDGGHLIAQLGTEQYLLTFPQLADGSWHSVFAKLDSKKFSLIADHLYKKELDLTGSLSLSAPSMLYTGVAPSSSHPRAFTGCIRSVELSGAALAVAQQLRTQLGCVTPNACIQSENICPTTSKCHRDWDQHKCKCHTGFVGDWCIDVCSVDGVCGAGGTCVRTALANATHAYDCICAPGRTGKNCEREALPQICPHGWYGKFPHCRPCKCPSERGFIAACNSSSGECICRAGTYFRNGACAPCECGFGARNSGSCDAHTGQCACVGEAAGRRCDRCVGDLNSADQRDLKSQASQFINGHQMELSPESLRCIAIKHKCPSHMEFGAQWPTTPKGTTVQKSCPNGHLGMMTRICSETSQWLEIHAENCTMTQLVNLKVDEHTDMGALSRSLLNITKTNTAYATVRDYEIIIETLQRLIYTVADDSLRDRRFVRDIVATAVKVLRKLNETDHVPSSKFDATVFVLNVLGRRLVSLYQASPYLRPFQIVNGNFVFAVDCFTSDATTLILPKGDNFIGEPSSTNLYDSTESGKFFRFVITLPSSKKQNANNGVVYYIALDGLRTTYSVKNKQASRYFAIYGQIWKHNQPDIVGHKSIASHVKNSSNVDKINRPSTGQIMPIGEEVEIQFSPSEINERGECAELAVNSGSTSTAYDNIVQTSTVGKYASCRFYSQSSGIFVVFAQHDENVNTFEFSLARSSVHTLPVCMALTLLACGTALCSSIVRRKVCGRPLRCIIIVFFFLNSSTYLIFQRNFFASIICQYRLGILTFMVTSISVWLFLYSFHLYKIVVLDSEQPTRTKLFWISGIALPLHCVFMAYLFQRAVPSCSNPLLAFASHTWPMLIGGLMICLASFHAIMTSLIMTLNSKEYCYAVDKFSVRLLLFANFLLIFLCAIHNGLHLTIILEAKSSPELQTIGNVLTVVVALYLLVWANLSHLKIQTEGDSRSAQAMWVDDKAVTTAVTDASNTDREDRPQSDRHIYEGVPNEWIPKMMSSETYVHHTLDRSLPRAQPHGSPAHRANIAATGGKQNGIRQSPLVQADRTYDFQRMRLNSELPFASPYSHYNSVNYAHSGVKSEINFDSDRYYQSGQFNTLTDGSRRHHTSPSSHCGVGVAAYSTLGRRHQQTATMSAVSQFSTLRSSHGAGNSTETPTPSRNGTLKFATSVDDEMNDAYYTYTAKRTARTTATTFN